MATFTWPPSYQAALTRKPRVLAQKFGDGYEQRTGDGINTNPAIWSLQFNGRSQTEADGIDNFLAARAGLESFTWTAPNGVTGRYLCREWSRTIVAATIYNLAAQFEEVFE
jgi:phage-related protein